VRIYARCRTTEGVFGPKVPIESLGVEGTGAGGRMQKGEPDGKLMGLREEHKERGPKKVSRRDECRKQ